MKSVCVFCGSSMGLRPAYKLAAQQLSEALAQRGLTLVYGGGNVGLMGALALFCQALQPVELCWLCRCDLNFAEKTLLVARNRHKPSSYQSQLVVNL